MNIPLTGKAKEQAAANKQTKPKATHSKWFGVFNFSCSDTEGFDFKKNSGLKLISTGSLEAKPSEQTQFRCLK